MSAPDGPLPAALIAALADRYRIERELGAGGMATVYLAEDLRHHRLVALKVLRPELSASLGGERFLREIAVTAGLQHPHVLGLYDSGQTGDLLWYVMPYVAGDTLRARLDKDGQLPLSDAVRIARGIASALAYAHKHGVIHRDIKPENILLAEGEALVADFGIARAVAVAGGDTLTGTGITLGTPTYMSPEQAAADKQLDGRSDIYSLGCVLYEMLAGDPPYAGSTAQIVTARKLTDPVPGLRAVRESVPLGLEEIVMRALARAPADRYATADELAAALERSVSGPYAATSTSLVAHTFARQLFRWRLGAAAAFVGCVVMAWLTVSGPEAPAASEKVVRSTIQLPDSVPLAFVGEATGGAGGRSLALSPDGRTLVYVGLYRGRTALYVRPLDDDRIRRLEGTEGAYYPFFSPNGQSVGFFANEVLKKVPLDGGAPLDVAPAGNVHGGLWLADGRLIFGASSGGVPTQVSETGGPATPLSIPVEIKNWSDASDDLVAATGWSSGLLYSLRDSKSWTLTTRGLVAPGESGASFDEGLSASPQFLSRDVLLVSDQARLVAVPFDRRSMKLRGAVIPLDDRVRQEAFGFSAQFAVSDEGTLVYAPGASVEHSVLVTADMMGRIDTLPFAHATYSNARFSPDGSRIAAPVRLTGGYELRVLDLTDGTTQRVALMQGEILSPQWSGDGKSLMFMGDTASYAVPSSGGTPRTLGARWVKGVSPDGQWTAWADGTENYVEDAKGVRVRVPHSSMLEFSRDGKWISWVHFGARGHHVRVRSLAEDGAVFTVTPDGYADAQWQPDGRALVVAGPGGNLYMVPLFYDGGTVRGGAPRRLTKFPTAPLKDRRWDLSPDGKKMLYVAGPATDTTTRLTVVTNFRRVVEEKIAESRGKAKP